MGRGVSSGEEDVFFTHPPPLTVRGHLVETVYAVVPHVGRSLVFCYGVSMKNSCFTDADCVHGASMPAPLLRPRPARLIDLPRLQDCEEPAPARFAPPPFLKRAQD